MAKAATSKIADKIEEAVETSSLEADVKQLRKDIDKLIAQLGKTGQHAQGAARKAAAVGVDQIKAQADDFKARAQDLEGQLIDAVREKPVTSLAIAAGVGYFFALLSRR